MVGPVRQELLSGVRDRALFERLRDHLRAFPDEPITSADYERAAECFTLCRAKGIQGSNTGFLLCAVAERYRFPILTTDEDFVTFSRVLPLRLHTPQP
jgi:predicted nucleic acid-binding protein